MIPPAPSVGRRSVFQRSGIARRWDRGEGDAVVMMVGPKQHGTLWLGHVDVDGGNTRVDVAGSVKDVVVIAAERVWAEEAQLILVGDE